ncbi:MAG: hypothetical protein K8S54_10515 [Spirochaetia bacterium]|nr:hypothetical protein [Spirochaetia bacterium]
MFIKDGWITVYENLDKTQYADQGALFCGLIETKQIKRALQSYSWDLTIGQCRPSHTHYYDNGKEKIEYHRFSDKGIEPFVLHRNGFGHHSPHIEISEEFRLYHNLYEATTAAGERSASLLYIDGNADEIPVVKIQERSVQVKLNFLQDYINARRINFVTYFELMRFYDEDMTTLKLKPEDSTTVVCRSSVYNLLIRPMEIGSSRTQAWLLGKVIRPFDKTYKPNVFGRMDTDENLYVSFAIGYDDSGNILEHTSNEEALSNYFGKNQGAPHYLTPVYFRTDVLKKYFDTPNKYIVHDGRIECMGFWSLRLDNSCRDYVIVFLGDLGTLPYKEQLYWKSFNIEKQGGMSHTGFKRAFLGEWADPDSPDLYFKMRLQEFNDKWTKANGWCLFKPLNEGDKHYFQSLHSLTSDNNEKEFDEQILNLTKIIIDSLNEKEMQKHIALESDEKGLDKLDKFLASTGRRYPDMIQFLRNLQTLRSTTVAHRRSDSNKKTKATLEYFQIGTASLKSVFDEILIKTIMIFNTLGKSLS